MEVIPTKYNDSVFTDSISIDLENDASKMIISTVSYKFLEKNHTISYTRRITNPLIGLGKSTCSDNFNINDIENLNLHIIDPISFESQNIPTDIDVVGNYLYITTDSSTSIDSDLFIYDIHNPLQPILVSSLNTGPGLNSLQVVGNYVYLANQSINGQLQVIDITNVHNPLLIKTIKLPGTYHDNTVVGNKIFYDNGKLYLSTPKNSINELHIFDDSVLSNPVWKSSFEINAGPNDMTVGHLNSKDFLYIASPLNPELLVLDVGDISHPIQVDQFDAPTGSGNGKSLDRQANELVLGRTLGNKELYLLSTQNSIGELNSLSLGASIDGLIHKSDFIFAITSKLDDFFQIFNTSSSTLNRIADKRFSFAAKTISMDCDSKNFFILNSDNTHPVLLINNL